MSKVKKLVLRTTCEGKLSAVLTPLYLAHGTMQSRVEKQFFKGGGGKRKSHYQQYRGLLYKHQLYLIYLWVIKLFKKIEGCAVLFCSTQKGARAK